jgi:hypothetical protein
MIDEWIGIKWSLFNLRYFPLILSEEERKTTVSLSYVNRSSGRDLSQGPPKCESRMLSAPPRLSLALFLFFPEQLVLVAK